MLDQAKRDYILVVDKSGSMSKSEGSKTRWEMAKESTEALARKCAQFDDNGIDVYLFSGSFKKFSNTTPDKVEQIFNENEPAGSTALHLPLQDIFDNYFKTKEKPITVLVITDGEPDDQRLVATTIKNATQRMDADEEIGISFLQVGKDAGAQAFLKRLDDDLQSEGAKFDIVDTKTFEEMENMTLTDVLIAAVTD